MRGPIITKVIEEMNNLLDNLQQHVLKFVVILRQQQPQTSGDAWKVLEALTSTIEAPADWSAEHDHITSIALLNAGRLMHDRRSSD
jgi:hypothetical protein